MRTRKRLTSEERKKQIQEAARVIFLEKGFKSATMENIISRVGMSKGGVYRYYANTYEILHDIMMNEINPYSLKGFFEFESKEITIEEYLINISIKKMVEKNEYNSLYALFLVEAGKNMKLKQLKDKMLFELKQEYLDFINEKKLYYLECLFSEEWIAFEDSIIVANVILDVNKVFNNSIDFFTDIVREYIEKHIRKE